MKTKSLGLIISGLVPFLVLSILYIINTPDDHPKGGFIRFFEPQSIREIFQIELSENSYFAGQSGDTIYIANTANGELFYLRPDKALRYTVRTPQIKLFQNIKPSISVTSSAVYYYYLPGSSPIFKPVIEKPNEIVDTLLPGVYNGLSFADGSIILRKYDSLLKQNNLIVDGTNEAAIDSPVLKKQMDGIFCTDGLFIQNPSGHVVAYVYYYRNQVILLDSISKWNTFKLIDTNSYAKIKLSKLGGGTVLSNIPETVNRDGVIDNSSIYIVSGIRSDNELLKDFTGHTVIDRYGLKSLKYQSSFYLPRINDKIIKSFRLDHQFIWALSDRTLILYKRFY